VRRLDAAPFRTEPAGDKTMPFYDSQIEVMFTQAQLEARVAELGAQITRDHRGRQVTVVSVLKGSFMFAADLLRAIDLPLTVDFLGLSSYGGGTETSGVVRITSDLSKPVEGRDVLVVEDIIDTGLTMDFLLENLKTRRPSSVQVCALLEKPSRAKKQVTIDYKGFVIPDAFVVGYGLDYDERYRNVPFIGVYRGA
jgi:hypoxanthine phosphoribosyltransferase